MAYSDSDDISSEFKDIEFSTDTAVTDTEVDGFCDQAAAQIDSVIASRYEVPVTGPISLLLLKMISILLVKGRILSILSVKTPQDKTKQDPDGPDLIKQAMDMLAQIKKGQMVLSDATLASTEGGLTSFLKNQDVSYEFHAGENDW